MIILLINFNLVKLLSIKYTNTEQEWGLKNYFFDLTLLVGVSGVGKKLKYFVQYTH
jgi:hypothetical protein